jgi:hypothetical protein
MKKLCFLSFLLLATSAHAFVLINNPPATTISSSTLPSGSTQYLQNTLAPGTTIQVYNVQSGVITTYVSIGTSTPNIGAYAGFGITIGGNSAPFFEMVRNTSAATSTLAVFRAGSTAAAASSGIAFKSGTTGAKGVIAFQTANGGAAADRVTIDEYGAFYINASTGINAGDLFYVANASATIDGQLHIGWGLTTNACGAGVSSCVATCPANTSLLGGGCNGGTGLDQDYPSSSITWQCTSLTVTTLTAYAFCARLAP